MANRLRAPIGRLSQAMIVLGICAVLIGTLLNVRDVKFLDIIEGQLLDLRFILRGPVPADKNIEIVLIGDSVSYENSSGTGLAGQMADVIDRLVAEGAEVIAIGPSLFSAVASDTDDDAGMRRLAASLTQVEKPIVPYLVNRPETVVTKPAMMELPPEIRKTALQDYRLKDGVPIPPVLLPTKMEFPRPVFLSNAMTGHFVNIPPSSFPRRYAYPVIQAGKNYYPSLAVETALQSLGLTNKAFSVSFGRSIYFGSFYVPTDENMRLAVNYRGPTGAYPYQNAQDLLAREITKNRFEEKLVLLGRPAEEGVSVLASPFGTPMPVVEFLATVIDNYQIGDPLDRSQQIIILDIIIIALIGVFFAVLATLRNAAVVFVLGILTSLLVAIVNFKAFALLNLWLSATFPLMALVLCTGYLVTAKIVSNKRSRLLAEAERADKSKYATPWIAERVAKARLLVEEEEKEKAAAKKIALTVDPDEDVLLEDNTSDVNPKKTEDRDEKTPIIGVSEQSDTHLDAPSVDEKREPSLDISEETDLISFDDTAEPVLADEIHTSVSARGEQSDQIEAESFSDAETQIASEVDGEAEEKAIAAEGPDDVSDVIFGSLEPDIEGPNLSETSITEKEMDMAPENTIPEPETEKSEIGVLERQEPDQELLDKALASSMGEVPQEQHASDPASNMVSNRFPVAILYINLGNFHKSVKTMGPTKMANVMHMAHDIIEQETAKSRGFVETYSKEGVMAVFGLPEEDERDAINALNCARNICQDLDKWIKSQSFPPGVESRYCCGLHFGPVNIEAANETSDLSLSLTGDTVFIASHLETLANNRDIYMVASNTFIQRVTHSPDSQPLMDGIEKVTLQSEDRDQETDIWLLKRA